MKSNYFLGEGRERTITKRFLAVYIAAVFVLTLLLSILFPGLLLISEPQNMELSITALGEKANDSWGCEVRIYAIHINDTPLDLTELAKDANGWKMDGDLLVAYDVQSPAVIELSLEKVRTISVNMYGQAGSGFVEFCTQDESERIDLYRADGWVPVDWEYQCGQLFSVLRLLVLFVATALLCGMLFGLYALSGTNSKLLLCLRAIFFGVLLYINVATVLFAGRTDYACKVWFLLPNQVVFLIDLCAIVVLVFLSRAKGLKKLCPSERTVAWVCLALFFVQIYLCYNYYFLTAWDVGVVYDVAKHIVDGTLEQAELYGWYTHYFSIYPNNRLLVFIMTICLKINQVVGVLDPENGVMVFIILNCAISTVAGWLLYRCLCNLLSKRWAFWGWIAYTAYIWISPWTVIPYSDSLGLIFPILSYYLYLKTKSGRYLPVKWAAMAFVGGIAYKVKPQAAIILIAIVLCEGIMRLKGCGMKKLVRMAGVFLVPLVFAMQLPNLLVQRLDIPVMPESSFSLTHYAMMGMNPETRGVYASDDFLYSESFPTKELRTQGNIAVIKARLSDYGVGGYLELLNQKLLTTYGDGTFAWGAEGVFFHEIPTEKNEGISRLLRSIYYRDGELQPYFYLYSQLFWVAILFLTVFSVFYPSKKIRMQLLPVQVGILGLTAFELLFEARARYLYTNAPLFLLLAVFGFRTLLFWRRKGIPKQARVESETINECKGNVDRE